jgi:hypothetical protein
MDISKARLEHQQGHLALALVLLPAQRPHRHTALLLTGLTPITLVIVENRSVKVNVP